MGSIFDEPCNLLVIPLTAGGTVTPEFQEMAEMAGLPLPASMERGLSVIELRNAPWRAVAYAAGVSEQASSSVTVEEIARALGGAAKSLGIKKIAAPLLGTGPGGLAPGVATGALSRGFMSTAPEGTLLVVSIRDRNTLAALALTFPNAVGKHIQAPAGLRALTDAEVHPRTAIPAPVAPRSGTEPGTYVERVLALIWEEVLGHRPVYLEDDFFALGGDSIHAVQIIARVAERLRLTLPTQALLEAPTLAGLARHVERTQKEALRALARTEHTLTPTASELTARVGTETPPHAYPSAPAAHPSARKGVFISYSHADAEWLQRLQKHLKPLQREGVVVWDDTRLTPGEPWRQEIREALAAAKVAVLLISADFLASDFIVTDELPPLLKAAEKDGATILPVIVSACRFARMESLSRFQAVNDPEKPLVQMRRAGREKVLDQVARAVEDALRR